MYVAPSIPMSSKSSMAAIIAKMRALRAERMKFLRSGMMKKICDADSCKKWHYEPRETNQYSVSQGLNDLIAYYYAGTFVGAIEGIQADAGAQKKKAEEDVQKKVADELKNKKPINNFYSMVTVAAKKRADELSGELGAVKADPDNTGFVLFPKGNRWTEGWNFAHVIGVLFSVGLLSLCAPFWYHSLKDLVSLRSQVAQNIADEQEQKIKQPKAPPPSAPPTVKPAEDPFAAVRQKVDALGKGTPELQRAVIEAVKAAVPAAPNRQT